MSLRIEQADPRCSEARALLAASHAMMAELFPSESNHAMAAEALVDPSIRFVLARDGDASALGCGALALLDGYGEIKSVFVHPDARGLGVARALLRSLEQSARAAGLPILRLETGNTLRPARALYLSEGFAPRGPFGAYVPDPHSRFYEKRLGT